jgi:8-oxo-dGTP diphosphatase
MPFTYEYARPALAVDCVVFGVDEELKVLLIQRAIEPFRGRWALPGGFVQPNEALDEAARRELLEETGLTSKVYLEQLYTFGAVERDPRERVVSVAYVALVKLLDHRVQAATDAREAAWFSLSDVPPLAFDHESIVARGVERLRSKVRYAPVGFELLPPKFTLSALQRLYEVILEKPLDKRNFRKKVLGMGILVELDEVEQDVAHRAARLYSFDKKRYRELEREGFYFDLG